MRNDQETRNARFSAIYEEQFSSIYNYLYAQILNRQETEDLTSETFLKAFRNFDRFDPGKGSARTWLTRIARNTLIDHFRTRRESIPLDSEGVPEPVFTDEYEILREPANREARAVLAQLSPAERELAGMIYFQDMKNPEIGEILGISAKAVSERHRRLLKHCREIEKGKDLSEFLPPH